MIKRFISSFKTRSRSFFKSFRTNIQEQKKKPRSKRKAFLLGVGTSLGLFGLAFFSKPLIALATDALTPNLQQQISRVQKNRGLVVRGARQPNNNGQGKPDGLDGGDDDDDYVPQFLQVEPVQETERLLDKLRELVDEAKRAAKSESESEEKECQVKEQTIKICHQIKEDERLVKQAEIACKGMKVQKDLNHLEYKISKGNKNPGTGRNKNIERNLL